MSEVRDKRQPWIGYANQTHRRLGTVQEPIQGEHGASTSLLTSNKNSVQGALTPDSTHAEADGPADKNVPNTPPTTCAVSAIRVSAVTI